MKILRPKSDVPGIIPLLDNHNRGFPKLNQYLKSLEPISGLDLGCRVPFTMFVLYQTFACTKLASVDYKNERKCVEDWSRLYVAENPDQKVRVKGKSTFFELYEEFITQGEGCKPLLESEKTFRQVFLSHFRNESMFNFFKSNSDRFKVIICSNVLHFYKPPQCHYFVDRIVNALDANGLLLIKVQDKPDFDYNKFNDYIAKTLPDSEVYETYNGSEWKSSFIINRSGLLPDFD